MENVIRELVKSYQEEAAENVRKLHTKESRADSLRQLEDDLVESKSSFLMLAKLFIHVGVPVEELKDSIDGIVEAYQGDNFYRDLRDRRTDSEKISFFARILIDYALRYEQVRAFIAKQSTLAECTQLDEQQLSWYRLYLLLIPYGMKRVIEDQNLGIYVYGFQLKDVLVGD